MKVHHPLHRRPWVHAVVLSLLCVLIYSNAVDGPFVFDGRASIENNPFAKTTSLDPEALYQTSVLSKPRMRPITHLTFALNYLAGKFDTRGYHVVNILIHVVNSLLVYALGLLILGQLPGGGDRARIDRGTIGWVALFAAALFAAHPIQTQSVTYLYQRTNSLASLFYLASLVFYIRGRMTEALHRRWALWLGGLLTWALALGTKQIAGILPVVILLYEWYFFRDLDWRWARNLKYLVVTGIVVAAVGLLYLGDNPLDRLLSGYRIRNFTLPERLLTETRVVWFYLGLLAFPLPSRLNLLHDFPVSSSLLDPPSTLFAVLGTVGLLAFAIRIARAHRLASFCIIWFFLNLAIESTVIGLELVFEHRLYLPMVAVSLLASYLLFTRVSARAWLAVICLTTITLLVTASYLRNEVWQDRVSLWSDVAAKNPNSMRALVNLGVALKEQGRPEEAVEVFRRALTVEPIVNPLVNRAKAHMHLATLLDAAGEHEEALEHFRESLRLWPRFAAAHNNYGTALARAGRLTEAAEEFSQAVRFDRRYPLAHFNLAYTLLVQDDLGGAFKQLVRTVKLDPGFSDAYYTMGLVRLEQGRLDEAIGHFSEALRVAPEHFRAHVDLGKLLLERGDTQAAIDHLSKAVELRPSHAAAHYNLAVALRQQGDLGEACDALAMALRIDPGLTEARMMQEACGGDLQTDPG